MLPRQVTKIKIIRDGYRCERCGHEWVRRKGRVGDPEICPECKSALWHTPPTTEKKVKKKKEENRK